MALAVIILVLLALIVVTTISVRNSTFARNQSLATKLAQELIEEARDLRNENKNDFFLDESLCDMVPDSESNPPFILSRECALMGIDRMGVTVSVTWTDAKGDHKSELYTELTKW